MLFSQANMKQVEVIIECMNAFSSALGLSINLHKSKLFVLSNVSRSFAASLSSLCGVLVIADLRRYLGVPGVNGCVSKQFCVPILETFMLKCRLGRKT